MFVVKLILYMWRTNRALKFQNERRLTSFPHKCLHTEDSNFYFQQTHLFIYFFLCYAVTNYYSLPVPVAALFKASVCGRSLFGIVGSNPAVGMDICLL